MSSKKIDLNNTVVESREQRLGTIISWDGKASTLSTLSKTLYSREGCGSNSGNKSCKLCELNGPFTQGTSCTMQMVECQAGHVRDAVLIQHSPIGCSAGQGGNNSIFRNGLAMRNLPVENIRIISTNLQENDMIFGGVDKLAQSIQDAWDRYHPKAIFIGNSCATGIIGDDIDSVASEFEKKLKIPVVAMHCEGFKSKHWSTGFDVSQHGILRQIVRKKSKKKQDDLVNVINLWGSDVFTPMLKELGLRVNYAVDLASVDELAQLSEAAATVGFCYTLSSYIAAALEQEFGVPEIKAPQPYGFSGTDAWIRELTRVTHREKEGEAYIAKEHARVMPRVKELRKLLKGKKGYVATGSAYSHGLIAVLKELEIEVDGSLVFHHDPIYDSGDKRQNSLAHLVDNYGDVPAFSVSNHQQYQFYGLLKRVNPDFILIRHGGLAPLATRLGIPAAPLGDENSVIGYQGIINLGEAILDILSFKKLHRSVAVHARLPYKKWWLNQKDPYILAKEPNLALKK
ncbi:nitrogenase component 1 [Clostridium kluyveri]|uniref:Nitrogenase n=1 Tax=Clostridium kluyveri TaxID=1534 RepID=A0A1L5F4C3_CLOKL|nr:nitrogenase component 1 [Clostridium kluyveri]APM37859.1 nitrogenase [Clostridium kluyveri]UZQ52138.1 nitrogenase [Clostridium kluyveri]